MVTLQHTLGVALLYVAAGRLLVGMVVVGVGPEEGASSKKNQGVSLRSQDAEGRRTDRLI